MGDTVTSRLSSHKGTSSYSDTTYQITGSVADGAVISNSSVVTFNDCIFSNNKATARGGAIFNDNITTASAIINNGSFIGNSATNYGGAIYNGGTATITNVLFDSNTATNGGAIYNNRNIATITNTEFRGNKATAGGAIYNSATAKITSGTFYDNYASSRGGAINNQGTMELENTIFSNNSMLATSSQYGGAIYNNGTLTLHGGNIFHTSNDNIYNNRTLNISGCNSFGADVLNSGSINFDADAVTALTGNANLKNISSTARTMQGTLLAKHDTIMNAEADTAVNYALTNFFSGKWNIDYSTLKVGTTAENAGVATTAASAPEGYTTFTNDKGARFWYVNIDTPTITNVMTVDGTLDADASIIKFASIANLKSKVGANFDGIINVTGGDFSGAKTFADDASLLLTGGDFGSKYVFGGRENANGSNKSVTIYGTITTNKSIYAGNQYLSTFSNDATLDGASKLTVKAGSTISTTVENPSLFLVAGSLFNGTSMVTDYGTHEMTIDAAVTSKYLIGTNVMGGNSISTTSGSVKMDISAGTYTCVAGAGYIQSNTAAITQEGDVTMNITGGSYQYIYGGVAGSQASYVSNTSLEGNVYITVNSSTNNVTLKYLFAGNSATAGGIKGDATVTFTGDGSKLTFDNTDSTVNGGNAATLKYSVSASLTRSLVFDSFSGNFGAKYIESFTDLKLTNGSDVTFTSNSIRLSKVDNWEFENGTSLKWAAGEKDFKGDSLVFGKEGDTLVSDWTVIAGGDGLFAGLDTAASVTIFGVKATKDSGVWSTSDYKLFVDEGNNSLKIGALAQAE